MRIIRKIAVLGSGVMGSGIACHFANAGYQVMMLDLPGSGEGAKRNQIAEQAVALAIKQKPAPLYHASFVNRITTGNLEDDLPKIKDADWIARQRARSVAERMEGGSALRYVAHIARPELVWARLLDEDSENNARVSARLRRVDYRLSR